MIKKIKKLAAIRSDTQDTCPFGLPIPFGCKKAGDLVIRMAHVDALGEDASDEEKEEIAQANRRLLMWLLSEEKCGVCRYAGKLFKDKDVVECNWDTDVSGDHEGPALLGSPFYYKHFSGIGLDGLYSYPLGFYTDNSIDRGMYYGMYSIESTGQVEVELQSPEEDKAVEEQAEPEPEGVKFDPRLQNDLLDMLSFATEHPLGAEDREKMADNPELDAIMQSYPGGPGSEFFRHTLGLISSVASGQKMVASSEAQEFFRPEVWHMTKEELDNITDFNDYIDQEYFNKVVSWARSLGLEYQQIDMPFKGRPFPIFYWYMPENKKLLGLLEQQHKHRNLMKKDVYHMINGIIYGFPPSGIVDHILNNYVDTKEELVQDMKDYFGESFAGQLISKLGI